MRRWANAKTQRLPQERFKSESITMSSRFQERVKVVQETKHKRCRGETQLRYDDKSLMLQLTEV